MTEEWKAVVGFPNYEVSNCGNVRSLTGAHGKPRKEPRPKANTTDKYGYHTVSLCTGKHACMLRKQVHILVLEAFGPPKPEGTQVAHLNGVRTDNRLENLMWATPKENTAHRWEHGTMQITLDAMWAGRDAYNAAKRGEV